MPVKAKCILGSSELDDVDVVNPGDWFGKTWLIEYPLGNYVFFLMVEADYGSDAIDNLCDSEKYGHVIRIDIDSNGADYAEMFQKGSTISGLDVPEHLVKPSEYGVEFVVDCWLDLNGKWYDKQPSLAEYSRCGNAGEPCDLENITISKPSNVRYFDPEDKRIDPVEGIDPEEYSSFSYGFERDRELNELVRAFTKHKAEQWKSWVLGYDTIGTQSFTIIGMETNADGSYRSESEMLVVSKAPQVASFVAKFLAMTTEGVSLNRNQVDELRAEAADLFDDLLGESVDSIVERQLR